MVIRIGLTGSIASGKSTVSGFLRELGAIVIDADKVAKEIVKPGTPALKEIVKCFGKDVLNKDGSLNRKKLADMVFSDSAKLKILNEITHPRIVEKIKNTIACLEKKDKTRLIVIDAPLLIETGLDKLVDEVWVVYVTPKTQIERLLQREKDMTHEEALKRINSQMSTDEKVKYADRVIYNNGSIVETKNQVKKLWEQTNKKSGGY